MRVYKKIFIFLITFIFLTGCEQTDFSIEIKSNKSLDFTQFIHMNDSEYDLYQSIYDIEKTEINNKFKYQMYTDYEKQGILITSHIDNIDEYSSSKVKEINALNYVSIINEKIPFLKRINFLLFDKYTATFNVNTTKYSELSSAIKQIASDNESENYNELDDSFLVENVEGKQYNFDFILPVKSYNNNSNSSNNKTLSWYIEGNRNNTIQFSFIIFNPAVMIVFLTLVSIGIVALVLIYKKRKLNQLIDMTSLRESISIDDYQEEKKKIDPYSAGGATVYNPAIFNYGKLSTTISPYDNQKTIDDLIEEYDEDYGEKEVIPLNDIKEPDFKMINEGKMVSLDEMKDVFKRKIDVEEIANNDEYDPLNELYNRKEIQKSIEKKLSAKIEEPKQEKATPTTTTFLGAQQKTEMGDTPKSTTFVLPKDSEKETIPEEKKINNEPRRNMFVTQDSPQNASVSTNNIPVKKPMFIDIPDAEEIIKTNTSSNQNGVIENNVSKQNETITEDKPKPNKFIN